MLRDRDAAGLHGNHVRGAVMDAVEEFFVEDTVDRGDARDGLDSSFGFYGDKELTKKT
ncbi:predicted protein [Sclerotinia sclerotiorum 1980 UF-70]|uniref:Uncharacterized protein n=2 Tax=Sclerotinia sclerotiorum (strain ATCC 18683 / 1980 / Ss-1) TaxID=665079 RepID=A7E757_SCLS1|nr:predicted protein [Sclerotinia sclerotiorum 1980 UF-70]APA06346.1 hypothetical protein sscle_01g011160 [Sclerotinia sclerotiorum 1980 UF-70]EDN96209.1 predicted protein [Sclerotinia sclerotiorum 1980 UF-70]